ncbi:MAG: hypothetical protein IPP47_21370 [Bryobacterales bacterium]|nr:hypothetical protein [Bryobacterales bacterium]
MVSNPTREFNQPAFTSAHVLVGDGKSTHRTETASPLQNSMGDAILPSAEQTPDPAESGSPAGVLDTQAQETSSCVMDHRMVELLES